MNSSPELPPNNREELEARVTALLLGELTERGGRRAAPDARAGRGVGEIARATPGDAGLGARDGGDFGGGAGGAAGAAKTQRGAAGGAAGAFQDGRAAATGQAALAKGEMACAVGGRGGGGVGGGWVASHTSAWQ